MRTTIGGPSAHRILAALVAVGVLGILAVLTARAVAAAPGVDRAPGPAAVDVLATGEPPVPGLRADVTLARTAEEATSHGSCTAARRGWRTTDDRVVLLEVWRCRPFQWAAHWQAVSETAIRDAGGVPVAVPGVRHGVRAAVAGPVGALPGPVVIVLARRGSYVMTVRSAATTDGLTTDGEHAADIARWQWDRLSGEPGSAAHLVVLGPTVAGTGKALAVLALGLYLAVSLVGWARNRARRLEAVTPTPADSPGLHWTDVTRRARELGFVARARFWIAVGCLAGAQALTLSWPLRVAAYALPILLFTLGRRHTPGGTELWGKHAESQIRTGKNPVAAQLAYLLSGVLLVVGLIALLVPAVLVTLSFSDITGPDGRWHPALMADEPHAWRLVPVRLLAADLMVGVVAVLGASGLAYRSARRRAARDATEKRSRDRRPPIIFLRNFADDEVTIRTSPLTRKSMVEKLGLRQFERFEEILVRYLSVYGPVVAVNDPRRKGAQLGAARESFPHDGWQDGVARYLDDCRMIVVAAAPDRPTEGLRWELERISHPRLLAKTVFVVPPYPGRSILDRWRVFQQLATRIPVPAQVAPSADHVLVVAPGPDGGAWHGFRAARRTDWAYAVALAAVAERSRHPVPSPGGGAPTVAATPARWI